MNHQPTAEEIMHAVQSSGYLMEQHVATQLEGRGFDVSTNVAFQDPEEGKSREIDAIALKRLEQDAEHHRAGMVEIIVECKNISFPLVFIERGKNKDDKQRPPEEFIIPFEYMMRKKDEGGGINERNVHAYFHLGFSEVHKPFRELKKVVQFCRLERKKEWTANHAGLYDSIFYPMAKAILSEKHELSFGRSGVWRTICLIFPVVITSTDLYLIDSEASNPFPRPIDYVSFQRELKSGKVSGNFNVTFVRQQGLQAFLNEVVEPVISHTNNLIKQRPAELRDAFLPWVD